MSTTAEPRTLTKKDFATDQEVRWCPGCGDYSILAAVQNVLPELPPIPPSRTTSVSMNCTVGNPRLALPGDANRCRTCKLAT